MREAICSGNSDYVEISPNTEEPRSLLGLRQLEEMGSSSSEHVMLSSGHGVYVPELSKRISSIHQLTPDQRASLSNNILFSINSYMADHATEMGIGLTHRSGRRQPSEDRDPPSDQEITPEVRNMEASTSQPAQ